MTTEIDKLPEFAPYRGETYRELTQSAAVIPGGDLVKGDALIGVPFVITRMTFRQGDYMNAATQVTGAYVTVECVTGDAAAFTRAVKRGRITEDCGFDPEEEIIFNEGGTGVYRQAVEVWEKLGWITLPEGPDGGESGASRFDTPLGKWKLTPGYPGEYEVTSEGTPVFTADIRLSCPRGLRVSEYENSYTKEGRTRYFA